MLVTCSPRPVQTRKNTFSHGRADRAREGDHVVQLVGVVVGDREMELEHETQAATGIEPGHGLVPGAGNAAEAVVIGRIE